MARQVLTHGVTGYTRGCRCDICRAGNTERQRRWRAAEPPPNKPVATVIDKVGTAWQAEAACADHPTDWWFQSATGSADGKAAVAICKVCPVQAICLAWALQWPAHDLHGIWGGTSQRERVKLQTKRKAPTWQPTPITLRTTGRISGERWTDSPKPLHD